ncbi:MAG: DMT family protein [Myxococcota bacterium]
MANRRSSVSHFPDEPVWRSGGRQRWIVPPLLMMSAVMMSLAWLGHLRYEHTWSFWTALFVSWALVLPEYALNTAATRWGIGTFSGAQMASIHLSSGVVCVALVSAIVLEEPQSLRQVAGYAALLASIYLIFSPGKSS